MKSLNKLISTDGQRHFFTLGLLVAAMGNGLSQDSPPTVQFSSPAYSVIENTSIAFISVIHRGDTNNIVTVPYATSDGTATAGKNYLAQSGTLTFAAGETVKTISIAILDDGLVKGDTTVKVTLSQPSAAAVLGAVSTTILTIRDNERPTVMDTSFNASGLFFNFNYFAVRDDGKVVLGWYLETGTRIQLLNADGSVDASYQTPPSSITFQVAVVAFQPDGKILAGGYSAFTNGINLVRFNPNGSLDLGFSPSVTATNTWGGGINAIDVAAGGSILIHGDFSSVNGVPRAGVALLGPDGSLDTRFNPAVFQTADAQGNLLPGYVGSVAVQSDGKLLAAGSFKSVAGFHQENLARLNRDGSVDQAFAPAVQPLTELASIGFLQLQLDGKLVLAGYTTNTMADGAPIFYLARLFPDGTVDASFVPAVQLLNGWDIDSLHLQADGKLLVGGLTFSALPYPIDPYYSWAIQRRRLLRLNSDGSLDRNLTAGLELAGLFALSPLAADPQGRLIGTVRFLSPKQGGFGRFFSDYSIPGAGFASADFSVSETNSTALITVLRSGDTTEPLSVHYTTRDGTAKTGVNYVAQSGTLQFAPLENAQSFTVPILRDGGVSGDRTVFLVLDSPSNATPWGSPLTAVLTIRDFETPLLDPSFDPRLGCCAEIRSLLVQPDGKILAGGGAANGSQTLCLRLNPDGTRDADFVPMTGSVLPKKTAAYAPVVLATALQSDGRILVGGAFERINGQAHTNLVRLNADGSLDTNFNASLEVIPPPTDNAAIVHSLIIQPDGKILLAGRFNSVNGVARSTIARLNSDGSLDMGFNPPPAGSDNLFALALQADGKVLAGGYQGLFRLNPDGSPDGSSFSWPNTVSRIVVLPDGKLLVNSGDRFNPDGSADSTVGSQRIHFNWGGCSVDSGAEEVLAVQADGKVWASGAIQPYCNNYSTVSRALLRLNPDGSIDPSSQPAAIADDSIRALAVEANGNVLIGGSFRAVNGVSRDGLARLFADHDTHSGVAYAATDYQVGEDGQNAIITVQRLGNSQGAFKVDYTTANGTAEAGADFAAQSGTLQFAPAEISKTITIPIYDHLSVSPDKQFQVVLSHPSDGVVLNAGPSAETVTIHDAQRPGSVDFRFHPQIPFQGGAARTAVQRDGKVLVSGLFTHPISGFRTSVLRLNTDGTIDNAFELRVTPYTYLGTQDSPVLAIAQQTDDKIVIGGAFRNPFKGFDSEIASHLIQSSVDVESPNGIARVNTDGTLDESFNPGTGVSGGAVRALAIQPDGKILIGGDFSTVNGFSRRGIARLNAAGELDPDFNVESGLAAGGINVTVLLLQADGKVLLGGSFAEVEGKVRTLARLNPDSSLDGTFDPGLGAAIYRTPSLLPRITSLAMQTDGKILVAGAFDRFNGEPRPSVTRLNADGSMDKSFSPHLQFSEQTYNSNPLSVAIQADGRILVAGIYLSSGNNSIERPGITRLNRDGTLDKSFDPGADTATGADCCVSSLVLEPDGKVLLGGTFTTFDHVPRQGLVRLHGDMLRGGATPLVLGSLLISNDNFTFSFQTLAGQSYTIQENTNLGTANWVPYRNITGDGSRFQFVVPLTPGAHFFHVREP